MIADAECVRVISEILSELQLGNFLVKVCMIIKFSVFFIISLTVG